MTGEAKNLFKIIDKNALNLYVTFVLVIHLLWSVFLLYFALSYSRNQRGNVSFAMVSSFFITAFYLPSTINNT